MSSGACYQFQQTGSCKYGDSCRFSHGGMGGAPDLNGAFGGGWGRQDAGFGRPAFGGAFGGGFGGPRGFGAPSSGPCYAWQESGQCRFGETCRYSHGDANQGGGGYGGSWGSSFARRPVSNQICYTWRDTGSCKFGDSCRYSHSQDGGMGGADPYGAPRRFAPGGGAGAGICYNFQQTGSCKFGDGCRFSHAVDGKPKDETGADQTNTGISDGQPHMEQN